MTLEKDKVSIFLCISQKAQKIEQEIYHIPLHGSRLNYTSDIPARYLSNIFSSISTSGDFSCH